MLNLELLFEAVSVSDLAQAAGVELRKNGRGYMGKCPFHQGDGESFSIYTSDDGHQRWHCFSVCDADGDALDFIGCWKGISDFIEQVKWLADYARISLDQLGWSQENVEEHRREQQRGELLTRAARFFAARLWSGEPAAQTALEYARRRGFTDEHIRAAGWGFTLSDRALHDAIAKTADRDMMTLAHSTGLIRQDGRDFTANRDGDTVSPAGWLVYPHYANSKARYFSSRAISEITTGDKARNLIGQRQPYRALTGIDGKPLSNDRLVVVEGPADAESLRAWGIASIALCGCSIREGDVLVEHLARRNEAGQVYLALSNDDAGAKGAATLANLVGPTVRIVRWPKKPGADKGDANDLLQAGGTADQIEKLLANAPQWMQELMQRAEQDRTEENLRHVVEAYGQLNVFNQAIWKRTLTRALDLTVGDFEAMCRATGQDMAGDIIETEYAIRQNMICLGTHDQHGGRQWYPLCNYAAQIVREVVEDDGEEQQRYFVLAGHTAAGHRLPEIEVEASEFAKMSWALPNWGVVTYQTAGRSNSDHLRTALQVLSPNVRATYVYSHLGWRKIAGTMRYLTASGAVGLSDVQVRLPHDLDRYRLPEQPESVHAALEASLRFLDTGRWNITMPVLTAMYLAPLAEILPPSFTIWLFGTTGSLKSTLVALAMCHYGTFAYNTPPASWTATANALEKLAFVTQSAPLWIDDYTAQNTVAGLREIKQKSDQLLRDWGNRTARGRMQANLKLRRSFVPRGLILSTAEQLPPGPSIIPRLFALEITPDTMTRGEGSALTQAQTQDASLYQHAMAAYVLWLAERWDTLTEVLRERHLQFTDAARARASSHLRMPGNVATMYLGWDMFLQFCEHTGVIDIGRGADLRTEGWNILIDAGEHQQSMVVEEDPVVLFINGLQQLFAQRRAYLRNKDHADSDTPEALSWPAGREVGAPMLGWYDDHFWYLLPGVCLGAVTEFYRRMGVVFPDTERGLGAKLAERRLSLCSQEDRYRMRVRIGSERPYVIQLMRLDGNIEPSANNEDSGDSRDSRDTKNQEEIPW